MLPRLPADADDALCRLLTGLASSGKSSLLAKLSAPSFLHDDPAALPRPPVTRSIERSVINLGHSIRAEVVDTPGAVRALDVADALMDSCDAVVFTIDSTDALHLAQARIELDYVLDRRPSSVRVLLLLTKSDSPYALDASALFAEMGLDQQRQSRMTIESVSLMQTSMIVNVLRAFLAGICKRVVRTSASPAWGALAPGAS